MNRYWLPIILALTINPALVRGQIDNSIFYDDYRISKADSAAVRFGLEAFGYVRNNEFRDDPVPGYTLFGYQFKPYFSYFPSGRIRLDAGGFFQKDFGEDDFTSIRPVFTLKYTSGDFALIFGSLEGAMSHRLIEPMYNFENLINRRIEDGLQLKYTGDRLFLDTWIEWINMISFGEDALEEFNYGLSFNYRLMETQAFLLEIPLQLIVNHRGGEIDVSPEPVSTLLNGAAGIGIEWVETGLGWLHAVRFEGYYSGYQAKDRPDDLPYPDGKAWYFNLSGRCRWLRWMLSYWNGEDYYAPYGGPLYQSLFFDTDGSPEMQDRRELLFFRLFFERELGGGLSLSFRVEPVYDLGNAQFDHSEGLYLRYRTDFLLNRKRKP